MLKRLRTAHPILYCILAEVIFLGSLFLISLVLTFALAFAGADFSALDEYLLNIVQELGGVAVAWLLLRRTGRQGLLGRRGSGFLNGLLVGMYPLALIGYSACISLLYERPDGPLLPAGRSPRSRSARPPSRCSWRARRSPCAATSSTTTTITASRTSRSRSASRPTGTSRP